MRVPDIELLWWAGCPSTERALGELRAALKQAGLSGAEVRMTEVRGDDEARERAFLGSPTIRIDGQDLAADGDQEVGLSCRVYRRRDGRIAPTPDPEDLSEALLRAVREDPGRDRAPEEVRR